VYQYSTAVQMTIAAAKNTITCCRPSIRSPTTLAKPVTWMRIVSDSYFARNSSMRCESAW